MLFRSNIEERTGRILHSSEFINILRKAGIRCWYRDHPQVGKVTLLVQRDDGRDDGFEVACWCQLGFTTELSVMDFDEHGIPLAEKFRGWRTCLLQMLLKGLITEEKINKYFGPPKNSPAWDRYNSLVHSLRRDYSGIS